MIKIAYLREQKKIKTMQEEVQQVIEEILETLDTEYGADRNYKDYGGYVIVVEKEEDYKVIKDKVYIDCETMIPEYVDKVVCSNGEIYTNSLIICSSDYTISLIIPLELTPQNLRKYMID